MTPLFIEYKEKTAEFYAHWKVERGLNNNGLTNARPCIEAMLRALIAIKYGVNDFKDKTYDELKRAHGERLPGMFGARACLLLMKNDIQDEENGDRLLSIIDRIIGEGNLRIHEGNYLDGESLKVIDKEIYIVIDWFFSIRCGDHDWESKYVRPWIKKNGEIIADAIVQKLSGHNDRAAQPQKNTFADLDGYHLNAAFWKKYEIHDPQRRDDELKNFFINPAYSRDGAIQKIIANDFYEPMSPNTEIMCQSPSKELCHRVEDIFTRVENEPNFKCLIRITGEGGSGKTTLLWFFGKKYHQDYETFYLHTLDAQSLKSILEGVHREMTVLLLIDSIYGKIDDEKTIREFFRELRKFDKVFLVVAERKNWLAYLRDFAEHTQDLFPYIFDIYSDTCLNKGNVFDQLLHLLVKNYPQFNPSDNEIRQFKTFFESEKELSLVEAKYLLFKQLSTDHKYDYMNFKFPWVDWRESVGKAGKGGQKYLYHFISLFQQYGQKVPHGIDFGKIFKKENLGYIDILETINDFKGNSPIQIDDRFIFIRHDKLGELLIDNLEVPEQEILKGYLRNYFDGIENEEEIYLFRNIHRKNAAFNDSSYFSGFVGAGTQQKRIYILEKYLSPIPLSAFGTNEGKCLTEIIKSYEEILHTPGNREKMLATIHLLIDTEEDSNRHYGRHMLANYYIKHDPTPENLKKAKEILDYMSMHEGDVEKVYSSQKKLYALMDPESVPEYWRETLRYERRPSPGGNVMKKIELLERNGMIEQAVELCKDNIRRNPNDVRLVTKISQILRNEAQKTHYPARRELLLRHALEYLTEKPEHMHKNGFVCTEMGLVYLLLNETELATETLEKGSLQAQEGRIGCVVTLAKIYNERTLKMIQGEEDPQKILENLDKTYTLLENDREKNNVAYSAEFGEVCRQYLLVYGKLASERTETPSRPEHEKNIRKYGADFEREMLQYFAESHHRIPPRPVQLLFQFYIQEGSRCAEKLKALYPQILSLEGYDFNFWFSLMEYFAHDPEYAKQVWEQMLQYEINDFEINRIVKKLNSPHIAVHRNELLDALNKTNRTPLEYLNARLVACTYYYSIDNIKRCKSILDKYNEKALTDAADETRIWKMFYNLITGNNVYINLDTNHHTALLKDPVYYFEKANEIKKELFFNIPKKVDTLPQSATDYKHLINKSSGISKMKALTKFHEENMGYENFYVLMTLGEIYLKNIPAGMDEYTRLKIAAGYLERAHALATEGRFSFLVSRSPHIRNENVQRNYHKRTLKDLIGCYTQMNTERSIARAEILLGSTVLDLPLRYLLQSDLLKTLGRFREAYEASMEGLSRVRKYRYNPEVFSSPEQMEGELLAQQASAMYHNWAENNEREVLGHRLLRDILKIFKKANRKAPRRWVESKINEIQGLIDGTPA